MLHTYRQPGSKDLQSSQAQGIGKVSVTNSVLDQMWIMVTVSPSVPGFMALYNGQKSVLQNIVPSERGWTFDLLDIL